MRRSIQNINSKLPLPGMPRAIERFLCPGSWEFDLKGYAGVGNLTLPGWGGKFEPELSSSKYLFLAGAYQTHMVVSEHGVILSREIYRFRE